MEIRHSDMVCMQFKYGLNFTEEMRPLMSSTLLCEQMESWLIYEQVASNGMIEHCMNVALYSFLCFDAM